MNKHLGKKPLIHSVSPKFLCLPSQFLQWEWQCRWLWFFSAAPCFLFIFLYSRLQSLQGLYLLHCGVSKGCSPFRVCTWSNVADQSLQGLYLLHCGSSTVCSPFSSVSVPVWLIHRPQPSQRDTSSSMETMPPAMSPEVSFSTSSFLLSLQLPLCLKYAWAELPCAPLINWFFGAQCVISIGLRASYNWL